MDKTVPGASTDTNSAASNSTQQTPPVPSSQPPTGPATPPSGTVTPPTGQSSTNPNAGAPGSSTPPPASVPPQEPESVHHPRISFMMGIVLLVLVFIGAASLFAWYYKSNLKQTSVVAQPTGTQDSMKGKKMVVGMDATFAPMEYVEKDNFVGYDIDLAKYIGNEVGAEVEFKNITFDDLFPALENKDVDMIISAVTITDERKQKYDFSEEYINTGQVILTQRTNTTIKSTADLKDKKIGVQKGTTLEEEALKYTSDNMVIRYTDFVQATNALVAGKVDAIFTDLPSAKGIVTDNPSLKISSDPFTNEYYGIVFRKGDPQVKEINSALRYLRVNGILANLKQRWLD